jgi:hypothetical protein
MPSRAMTVRRSTHTLVHINDWCKNTFEVVSQLRINTDYSHHRYDVILLINGIPVVQIELKTLGINPRRAIEQIVDYKSDPGNGYRARVLTGCGSGLPTIRALGATIKIGCDSDSPRWLGTRLTASDADAARHVADSPQFGDNALHAIVRGICVGRSRCRDGGGSAGCGDLEWEDQSDGVFTGSGERLLSGDAV